MVNDHLFFYCYTLFFSLVLILSTGKWFIFSACFYEIIVSDLLSFVDASVVKTYHLVNLEVPYWDFLYLCAKVPEVVWFIYSHFLLHSSVFSLLFCKLIRDCSRLACWSMFYGAFCVDTLNLVSNPFATPKTKNLIFYQL